MNNYSLKKCISNAIISSGVVLGMISVILFLLGCGFAGFVLCFQLFGGCVFVLILCEVIIRLYEKVKVWIYFV